MLEALFDRTVEMTDGREVLGARNDVLLGHQRLGLPERVEALRVGKVDPFGTLQVEEVAQCPLAERNERELDPGWKVTPLDREVRSADPRRRADGGEQVVHLSEVEHLLARDLVEGPTPPLDVREAPLLDALVGRLLEAERREQVLAGDRVLELGGL